MIDAVEQLSSTISVAGACSAMAVPRATYYRRQAKRRKPLSDADRPATPSTKRHHPRQLSNEERRNVLDVLHSERFMDSSPGQVVATLLDEEVYHCSERTMYRILDEKGENRERRNQLVHPAYKKPELLATGPNQVWSWDITMLKGPVKWTYFYLYVIIDIFSRYVVGWMIAESESASLAKHLIAETCDKYDIGEGQLTIHADRGKAMKSKLLAQLLADLGVTKSHSRPHVSDDNPFSESQFKTMKYRPEFPGRFECFDQAKRFCQVFFDWYNRQHHHSGIAMLTPEQLHYGQAEAILEQRQRVLEAAYRAHPERFVNGPPSVCAPPQAVWINPPVEREVVT
jgi:putative transposase